tara:strand:- start:625 stop:840 length:216 start_codon:yes stop_codon:yes gene_type:complete
MLETYTIQLEVEDKVKKVEIHYDGINPHQILHTTKLHNKILQDVRKGMESDMMFFHNFETRLEWKIIRTLN